MTETQLVNNGAQAGLPEGKPAHPGFQRRIDKLIREKHELRADLERALGLIERYKAALRAARSANHV